MSPIAQQHFDPLLPPEQADAMLRLCERFGRYGTYAVESIEDDFGAGLTQRHDAVLNFLRTGGRFSRHEAPRRLAARTNYFREEYAYATPLVSGIEPFLGFEGFREAARKIHDCTLVEPSIVYANLLVPGQELSIHTDVPEFRGMSRRTDPQWLLVAMHHSGLFDRWRIPIATAVAWFGTPRGGEFAFYPHGADGGAETIPARHNSAIVLDTDTVFHGVDRVGETSQPLPDLVPDVTLAFAGDGCWQIEHDGRVLARYGWDDLRFSVSWKAYCYRDAEERRLVEEHRDDLRRARAIEVLADDLRRRGRIQGALPGDTELALTIIDAYIHYPPPIAATD